MTIVKIQKPLFSTTPTPVCLIYDKSRLPRFTKEVPFDQLPNHVKDLFNTGELKIYAEAKFINNRWKIGNIVEAQSW